MTDEREARQTEAGQNRKRSPVIARRKDHRGDERRGQDEAEDPRLSERSSGQDRLEFLSKRWRGGGQRERRGDR